MTARSEALSFARQLGVEPEAARLAPRGADLTAEAPEGMVWAVSDTHEIVARNFTDVDAAWADLLGQMRQGVESCVDPDCEWCP